MDTHANVLRWRENAFRRDRVEPSSWVIDGHEKGLHSEILSRQNFHTKRCLVLPQSDRELIKLDNQTTGSLSCPCVGLFAVDFEHPLTPRLASLQQGKRESVVGAAKSRWQVARVPCTC